MFLFKNPLPQLQKAPQEMAIFDLLQGGGLEDLRLKEGRSIRFDVWVAGEPPPTIEWFRNDTKLVNDDLTSISIYTKNASVYSLKNAVLSIPKVNSISLRNSICKCKWKFLRH